MMSIPVAVLEYSAWLRADVRTANSKTHASVIVSTHRKNSLQAIVVTNFELNIFRNVLCIKKGRVSAEMSGRQGKPAGSQPPASPQEVRFVRWLETLQAPAHARIST